MIKKIIQIIYFSLLLFVYSCEDNINYKADFEEEAVLYCIINADVTEQYALVKKSYENEGTANENYISNVQITLSTEYQYANLEEKEGDGSVFPKHYYSTNNFKPADGSEVNINAKLDNSIELSSTVKIPAFSLFFFDRPFFDLPLTDDSESSILRWTLKNPGADYTFLTALYLEYSVFEYNEEISKRIEVPIDHHYQNGNYFPIFPGVTENNFQRFNQETINIVLTNISEGDTNKSKYKIIGGYIELYVLEENLANYFSSTKTFKESFSIKVYENDISNIIGGRGVFGAYIKRRLPVEINPGFIKSFGYSIN